MTEPDTISADYSLRPSELASTLALLVEARQPVVVWGAPGCAKSQIAQQVAAQAGREYVDVRALLLDPVDLRGIPWRDGADRTAQRRNEVSEATWTELDLDQRLWTIPGERTKNGKPHFVHLSDKAKAVLEMTPNVGGFIFTSNGKTPFSGFSKAKKRLDDMSSVTDWRLHDIRRTVTTGMATLGIAPHIADKVMNHQSGTISGVAAVYQRHEFLEERKTALEAWGRHVQALLDGTDKTNVVNIH